MEYENKEYMLVPQATNLMERSDKTDAICPVNGEFITSQLELDEQVAV